MTAQRFCFKGLGTSHLPYRNTIVQSYLKFGRRRLLHGEPKLATICASTRIDTREQAVASRRHRYAVLGGGFAGLAACWHIVAQVVSHQLPADIELFEFQHLGAGGSGAAAGLLHPFSPKGKLLWKGDEAMAAALKLVAAAEEAARELCGPAFPQFVWHNGILRPAANDKQAAGFRSLCAAATAADEDNASLGKTWSSRCVTATEAASLVPGLVLPQLSTADVVGLMINEGVVLHPDLYMKAVWLACEKMAQENSSLIRLSMKQQEVRSLAGLENCSGPYDGIIVAVGAAAGCIKEIGPELPLEYCQGYTLQLENDDEQLDGGGDGDGDNEGKKGDTVYPYVSPSLLSSPYLAFQGERHCVVGATKKYGYTAQQSMDECGCKEFDAAEVEAAEKALLPAASELWPQIKSWRTTQLRSGVRALPPRTPDGALPLIGRIPPPHDSASAIPGAHASGEIKQLASNWWLICGLGARGLLYHAMLGQLVAEAVVHRDNRNIPDQLTRWRTQQTAV